MITLRLTADVKADRRVVLTLPPEVPTGRADLVITVESPQPTDKSLPSGGNAEREKARAAALDQFLALARSSLFRSASSYPTRDDLHERPCH